MALLQSVVHDPGAAMRFIAVVGLIVLGALVATVVFGGAAGPNFDLTTDPSSTLWSW